MARKNKKGGSVSGGDILSRGGNRKGFYAKVKLPDGKYKTVSGKTVQEVKDKRTQLLAAILNNTYKATVTTLFGKVVRDWLITYYKPTVELKTYTAKAAQIEKYLLSVLGNKKLSDITTADIQQVLNSTAQIRDKTIVKAIKSVCTNTFKQARADKIISDNPCDMLIMPKTKKADTDKCFTIEDRRKLLQLAETDIEAGTVIILLYQTGLRIGEFVALDWTDVDFDNKTISVNKAIQTNQIEDGEGGYSTTQVIGSPKTEASNRTVVLPDMAINQLHKWKEYLTDKTTNTLLYPDLKTGKAYSISKLRNKLKKLAAPLNLTIPFGFHKLRHTNATAMFEQGASAKTTQAQLGHSDIQITLGTYTHIQGNAIYAAAEAMNKANQALEVMRR